MGRHIRDDRQMQALTEVSQAQFAALLPVFRAISQAPQQQTSAAGGRPERAGAHRVGAPKAHCPPWQRRASSSAMLTRPLRPLLAWGHRARWDGRKPTTPSRSSCLFWTIPWGIAHGCRSANWAPQQRCKRRYKGVIQGAWTPPNGPLVVRRRTPNSVSPPGAKKRPMLQNTGRSLPEQRIVLLGRTCNGHPHDYSLFNQALPPEVDGCTALPVRVDVG
jgi:hypothetical protein